MNTNDIIEYFPKKISNKECYDEKEKKIIKRSEITGKTIKYLRSRVGFTQKEVSEKIGIAQQTYAGYESGKHEPNIEIMIRLADIYNVSMDYITGRYWGNDEERAEIILNAEEYLKETIDHYTIQRMNDLEFMKQINRKKD